MGSNKEQPSRTHDEDFYKTLVEQSNECVILLKIDGTPFYASPALKKLLGYTPSEYLSLGGQVDVHPKDMAKVDEILAKLSVYPKASVIEEVRVRHKNGSWCWIEASGSNLLSNPSIKALVFYIRDIPKRKDAEEKLKYRTALLEAQNETTPDGVLVVNDEGQTIYYNKRFIKLWKIPKSLEKTWDRKKIISHILDQLNDPEGFMQKVEGSYKSPKGTRGDELRLKDGRIIERSGMPIIDQTSKEKYGWGWYFRDITEAKKAEEAIRTQNEYLTALQETAITLTRRLEPAQLLETILEHGAQLANAQDGYIYLADYEQDLLRVEIAIGVFTDYIGHTIKKGEGVAGQVWKTGRSVVVEDYDNWSGRSKKFPKSVFRNIAAIPLLSGNKVVGVIALAHRKKSLKFSKNEINALKRLSELASIALDNALLYEQNLQEIEDRKHAETMNLSLAAQQERLLELNRSKDEFISLASHQLRTPATGVKQYVGMLLAGYAGEITDQQRQLLNTAFESNERQLKIINDLLKVAHLDAGKVSLHKHDVDIINMLEDVIDEQADTFKGRGQGAVFRRDEPSVTVRVDEDRIRMVLENVIDNASKYSLHGSTVTISVKKSSKNLLIRVADQGVGIAAEDQEKLFKKFSRIDNPLSTLVGGTGLGLYWAKEIIDLHGGGITVNSEPKKGTTFTIKLPL